MKTTIYLVRHGEVENPDDIFYGRLPGYRLSQKGKEQAVSLGKHLSQYSVTSVYASPLERTHETASIVSSQIGNQPVIHDKRFLEIYNPAQGKPFSVFKPRGDLYDTKWLKLGGERMSDIWFRMHEGIEEVAEKHEGQHVVVVSHGDPIMITAKKYTGLPLRLSVIRTPDYVKHAHGFEIVFEGRKAVRVEPLVF